MGEAIGQILSYGVAVALSAFPIIGVVLMLATPRARTNGPALLLGWSLGLALVGTIVLLVSGGVGPSDQGQPADWVSALDLTLGVLLLWVAVKEWRGRPRDGKEVPLPKWMRTVDSFTPVKALALGTAMSALNPKNLLLSIAAASAIARTDTSAGAQAVALAVYVVLGALGPGTPVVLYFALRERSKHILDDLRLWMEQHNTAIMAVICLLFAAKLVGNAVSDLSS
ncbi:GAP family protein [Streptomyces albogriseolus]|uniref:GAP family protein n=1 Tax=Streptomyces albogriseolus TaxID=1887 RepID=UPI00167919AD|nr:GAP family protein [Streptomyces viridodiastaticus]MCX4570821.1 GAP family protein [Streptomyces viridodiastaticus]GHG27162.1 membrane protein [Streptomyces viridodiastaticus]